MSKKEQAIRRFRQIMDGLEPRRDIQRGMLGDGSGNIRVTNRPDYVYVRVKAAGSAIWEVINSKVADIEDLPVLIEKTATGNDWQIIDVDIPMLTGVADGWSGEKYLPNHASSHEWPDGDPGSDAVDVHPRALTPLRCYPKNTTELKVRIAPLRYTYGGQDLIFEGGELNLASYQPASGLARYVLTYLDPRDNAMYALQGTTGFDSPVETLPKTSVPPYAVLSADVRLDGDQSAFTEDDMVDRREFLDVMTPDGLDAPFIVTTYHAALSAERMLVAGSGITLTDQGPQQGLVIASTAGGAPSDAPYLVTSYNATLTQERVFATRVAKGIKATDGGANASYEIELDIDGLPTESAADDADSIAIYDDSASAIRQQTRADFLALERSLFVVKNTSGSTANANDVGYIDENGEYQTTATAYDSVAWCVVIIGGANNADIYVAKRGRVTVTLDGNCSAGDYLYTSTTAGQAQSQTYVRPEVFAVALTANSDGAGGTCEALLLCNRKTIPLTASNDILNINNASDSDWRSTCNGAPAGAVVTYNTPLTSGAEDTIVPTSSNELGNLVLHNTTRTESALIDSVDTGANTITVTAAADVSAWSNADVIVVRSQTNTASFGGGTVYFFDVEITSSNIPALTTTLHMQWILQDSGAAGQFYWLHPFESDASSKRYVAVNQVAGIVFNTTVPMGLIQRRFCLAWNASGASTAQNQFRVREVVVAAP